MTVAINEQAAVVKVLDNESAIVQIKAGPFGPQGVQGEAGPQGEPGGSVINGSGTPSNNVGNAGDIFIDTNTGFFYGPKTDEWPEAPFFLNRNQRFIHTQSAPSDSWVIDHDLGGNPSVSVTDTDGNIIIGDIQYISSSRISIRFSAQFSGLAYLT